MTIVGVLHLTSLTATVPSGQAPATLLLSHLSDLYPTQSQAIFYLDHRLFTSTSSLLPNSNVARTNTHLFTSTHTGQTTFLSTTSTNLQSKTTTAFETITVPNAPSLESFTSLIHQKLQPQWAPRQSVVLEHGATMTLPLPNPADWKLSIGDLRVVSNNARGSSGSSVGAGQSRGVVIEIQYTDDNESKLQNESEERKYEALFINLLKQLFANVAGKLDLKLDNAKMHLIQVETEKVDGQSGGEGDAMDGLVRNADEKQKRHRWSDGKPAGSEIAELYMEVLRGSRG